MATSTTSAGRPTVIGSPTSETADNSFQQIKVLNVESGEIQAITSDRYNSGNPTWSSDGKWLYFLSDRKLKTTVRSPWGPREPDPHFDHAREDLRARSHHRPALALPARRRTAPRHSGQKGRRQIRRTTRTKDTKPARRTDKKAAADKRQADKKYERRKRRTRRSPPK